MSKRIKYLSVACNLFDEMSHRASTLERYVPSKLANNVTLDVQEHLVFDFQTTKSLLPCYEDLKNLGGCIVFIASRAFVNPTNISFFYMSY